MSVARALLCSKHVRHLHRDAVRCYSTREIKGMRMKIVTETPDDEKYDLPVEIDAQKLVSEVCGTKLVSNEENIKIKPDSEYPDWLWTLHIGKPLELHEMDPNTLQYWEEVQRLGKELEERLNKLYRERQDRK